LAVDMRVFLCKKQKLNLGKLFYAAIMSSGEIQNTKYAFCGEKMRPKKLKKNDFLQQCVEFRRMTHFDA
jgi:hypothetical protein